MTELPQNWVWTKMLDMLDYEGGSQPPKKEFVYEPRSGYIRLLQIRDFGDKPFPTYVPDSHRLKKANREDLLLARYGGSSASDSLGRICTGLEGAYNVALAKLVFSRNMLDADYVKYLFMGPWFKEKVSQNSRSCQTGFNRDDVIDIEFPLAPLKEQRRIATKLEVLLSRGEAAQTRLENVLRILKRFRQSVLVAACSGRLTADWRENNYSGQDGESLYRELRLLRRTNFDREQLDNFTSKGKSARGDRWKLIYEETERLDVENFQSIPETWAWIPLSDVVTRVKRGPSLKCNQDALGVRYITSGNLEDGEVRLDFDQKYLAGFQDMERCRLLPGDLILNCVNSLEKIGKSAVFEERHGEAIVGFNNYALELQKEFACPYYLNFVCQSASFQRQLFFVVKHAINQVSFATAELDLLAVPLAPLTEQQEIVRRVEALFKTAEALEARYRSAKAYVDRLTQSILAKAFRGELVPQDPNDEPASVLLERIRMERNGTEPKKGSRRK